MIFVLLILMVLCPLIFEWRLHVCRLRRVPVRIHVHGTRGKTSLTKEIAARLRVRGITTLARTTGDAPELILPDGAVVPWKRRGPARIQEYARFIRLAARHDCRAVVMECMALAPENIAMTTRLLGANIVAVTNTRPDHQEVMGETHEALAAVFSLLLPRPGCVARGGGCYLVVGEDEGTPILSREAEHRSCRVVTVRNEANVPPWRRAALLADAVEKLLDEGAGDLLAAAANEPRPQGDAPGAGLVPAGLAVPVAVALPGTSHIFLDLFSVNDVSSAREALHAACSQPALTAEGAGRRPWVALLATRQDRPLRTRAFALWLAEENVFSHVLPVGGHSFYARRQIPPSRRVALPLRMLAPRPRPELLLQAIEKKLGPCVLVGLGNAHGYGEMLRKYAGGM